MVYFSGNNTDLDAIINVVPHKANAKTEICMKEIYGGGGVGPKMYSTYLGFDISV